jgi:hypothetical protein
MVCLNCSGEIFGEARIVDSLLGVAMWNKLHPEDERTELVLCSDACTLELGRRLGEQLRDQEVR